MHPQNGNGADGEPQGAPNVYHPYPDGRTAPAYEAYTDPAAAHGWQGEYDDRAYGDGAGDVDTEQMDVYVDEVDAGPREESHGRGGSHRRARTGGPDRRRTIRLAAIAAGAACLVLLVAVIAGLFDSGSSGGSTPSSQGKEETGDKKGGEPSTGQSASPTRQPGSGDDETASASATPAPSKEPGDDESGSADPTESSTATKAPVTKAPTTAAAPTTNEPGNGNGNPGHGQGATKKPR